MTFARRLVLLGLAFALGAAASERPSFLFLLADDLGYGDLGSYGRSDIQTPHLDQLAAEGVRFTQHYANGPECTPTRAALLTGRYQHWIGGLETAIGIGNVGRYPDAIRLAERQELGLPTDVPTIVRLLKGAGYRTAIAGKWHLGYEPKFQPHLHGFDRAFYATGGGMDYFHYLDNLAGYNLFRDGDPISAEGYFTDLIANEAVDFVQEQRAGEPFFLYVPFTAPHAPFQGPQDRREHPLPLDSRLWNQSNAPPDVYIAMIESMDAAVGRILDALAKAGFDEDTVVMFSSDNGGTRSARNEPLRGIKGSTFEGGVRVPAMLRWKGKTPAGAVAEQVSITFDWTKSMAELAGVAPPADHPFDGIDLVAHVVDQRPDIPRTLFWRKPRGETIWRGARDGDLKWVSQQVGDRVEEYLFDLAADPRETKDVKKERPDDFRRLQGLYEKWERRVRANRRGRPNEAAPPVGR